MARRDPFDTDEEPPEASGQSDDLIRELAKSARGGATRRELRERLSSMGFEGAEGEAMLDAALAGSRRGSGSRAGAAPSRSGGGVPRILVWILVLGGINLFAYVFKLGFWIW